MVERGVRGRQTAASVAARDQPAPAQCERRRLWIVLGGAIVMAAAGALAGARVGFDDIAYPDLRGPRLRVSPAVPVKPASLSRDAPSAVPPV